MQKSFTHLNRFMGSVLFFRLIVFALIISAVWIALSGQYPMAFDEDFHLGLIRLYASHAWPFFSGQPANADAYGAVARDPSFLYHYLMSFPYRVICLFTNDNSLQVLLLRALNIALFASCLPLFRRLLRTAGGSPAVVNACLAIFILLPISPLLAAQINYDNLLLPVTALTLLLTLRLRKLAGATKLLGLLTVIDLGIFGSLIKFAFLPIFFAILLWLLVTNRHALKQPHGLRMSIEKAVRCKRGILLLTLFLMLTVLGFNRYGVNLIRYHDPVPDCGKVLSLSHCANYGPYIRDYNYGINKSNFKTTPYDFSKEWLYGMWLRTMFAVDGPKTQYETRGPFIIPANAILVLLGLGLLALLLKGWQIWRPMAASSSLFVLVSVAYVAALWLQEYKAFAHTGFPVAINGRYLLPVSLLVMLLAARALARLLGPRPLIKSAVLLVSISSLMIGGGALTYILRSNDTWYWNSRIVRTANHGVQRVLGPITPGNDQPQAYLR